MKPRSFSSVSALGVWGFCAACLTGACREPAPPPSAPVELSIPKLPHSEAADAATAKTAESQTPEGTATCSGGIRGLIQALAIPHGNTGVIEIVLAEYPVSCAYWTDPTFAKDCGAWRARINLPPQNQKPGAYKVGQEFAYLDRSADPTAGRKDAGTCSGVSGGNLDGTIGIVSVDSKVIVGSLCETATTDNNPKNRALIDGTFTAKLCPACSMTGTACKSNAECCTGNCSGGHCNP